MRLKFLAALGFAAFLAACASDEPINQVGDTTGTGDQTASTGDTTGAGGVNQGALPGSPSEFEQVIGNTVYFETDSYNLTAEAQGQLQRQAAWLAQYPQYTMTVEGHCDERGTREYNLALGERRANSVANYLVALGVDQGRVSVISYGKERPNCTESDESCWGQNRRGVTSLNQ